ncbi:MAG TPA: 4Fe-4S dicluster domain-containing protein [Candidatus Methylomirabilis sp.]|nr:4Fe-4S dicluster domain-containing protein [Candidatus Methylomirabilis sp.]
MRAAIQALSLLLFTVLFALANHRLPDWLPADIYLRLDPLLGLSAVAAGRAWVARATWGLVLIAATLLFGRFFCAYVCPLGAILDFLDPLLFRRVRRRTLESDARLRKVKHVVLTLFIAAALAGSSLVYLLDPMALLTRTYTFAVLPPFVGLANLLLDAFRPVAGAIGWVSLATLSYAQPVFYMSLITSLIFAGIIALGRLAPRFWCRYLCPLGALLSLLSPLARLRRKVGPECPACGACQDACPMGAAVDEGGTRLAECIQCRTCVAVCPEDVIAFPPSTHLLPAGDPTRPDLTRRGFLYSVAGGVGLGFVVQQSPFTPLQNKQQLIRPPGALPEGEFLTTCIRCGECMKSCLTNTLQPSLWEGGLAGLWTPKLDFRLAACEQECNVCGKVCPTQAIRSLGLEEKTHAKLGTAVLKKEMCLVWAQDKLCLICDEICPYDAIVFRTMDGYRRPFVVASRCNGCGYCEQRCPVEGESAIVVVPIGQIRLRTGSYAAEAKKLRLDFKPNPGDDQFILRSEGLRIDPEERDAGAPRAKPSAAPATARNPTGFSR